MTPPSPPSTSPSQFLLTVAVTQVHKFPLHKSNDPESHFTVVMTQWVSASQWSWSTYLLLYSHHDLSLKQLLLYRSINLNANVSLALNNLFRATPTGISHITACKLVSTWVNFLCISFTDTSATWMYETTAPQSTRRTNPTALHRQHTRNRTFPFSPGA